MDWFISEVAPFIRKKRRSCCGLSQKWPPWSILDVFCFPQLSYYLGRVGASHCRQASGCCIQGLVPAVLSASPSISMWTFSTTHFYHELNCSVVHFPSRCLETRSQTNPFLLQVVSVGHVLRAKQRDKHRNKCADDVTTLLSQFPGLWALSVSVLPWEN